VEQAGTVRVLVNGVLEAQPFIDVSAQLVNQNEQGLLGMAFHPNYAENGLFYLHYSSSGDIEGTATGDTVVAEFQVDANNRSVANPASRRVILTTTQPQQNHNGGQLAFGPDGMLYLGLGDGGGGNDQHGPIGNGQSLTTLLGKILRIDPTGRAVNNAYSVPDGNLAAATNQPQALAEIWAYGLRNPWRFSFDACNGDLYIGDVGQDALEELDYVAANAETRTIAAGLNFGWRIMEGTICGPQAAECTPQTQANLVLPIDEYDHDVGQSISGGYVYRGSRVPGLRGTYIYADYQSPHVFRFRVQDGQAVDRVEITNQLVNPDGDVVDEITSFGTDNAGEVYIASSADNAVYRLIQAP
jgi:glucose/arabinose dehydrogenase